MEDLRCRRCTIPTAGVGALLRRQCVNASLSLYRRLTYHLNFATVNAIIFLAPISAFDQTLAEDPRVNRLEDSMLLWRSVVSNKLLRNVNIILFLNKCDLLKAKLDAGVSLAYHMTSYRDRGNDYESVSKCA